MVKSLGVHVEEERFGGNPLKRSLGSQGEGDVVDLPLYMLARRERREREKGWEKESFSRREHYITSLAAILDHPSRCQSIKNMKFF